MGLNWKRALGIVATIGILFLLWYISNIVVYVAVSIVITLVTAPLMKLLDQVQIKSKQLPDWTKALLILITVYLVVFSFFNLFTPILVEEVKIMSGVKFDDVYETLEEPVNYINRIASDYNIRMDDEMTNEEYVKSKFISLFDLSQIPNLFGGVLSGLGNVMIAIFSITFISFFLLKDRWIIEHVINSLTPDDYLQKVHQITARSKKTLSRYFVGLLLQVTAITTIVSIALTILGVKNALVIGFFAGIINVIPYIGPWIGASFGLIIGLTTNFQTGVELLPFALKIIFVFGGTQLVDNFVFQPLIFSNSINAHPLEIFLVILVAGKLAGIVGMVIAVPAYSFLRIVASEFFSEFKLVKSMTKNIN